MNWVSGLSRLRYRIDGGDVGQAALSGRTATVNLPFVYDGYCVVELWVWDLAGNQTHGTYWYQFEKGTLVSVQPVRDGRFRAVQVHRGYMVDPLPERAVTALAGGYPLAPQPLAYIITEEGDMLGDLKVEPITNEYKLVRV